MNVALVTAAEAREQIITAIKQNCDTVDITLFTSCEKLVAEATNLNLQFDKVIAIASKKATTTAGLATLANYFQLSSPNTTMLFVVPNTPDASEYQKYFHSYFNSPLYTDVVAVQQTLPFFIELVNQDVDTIREKYGSKDNFQLTSLNESVDDYTTSQGDAQQANSSLPVQPVQPVQPAQQIPSNIPQMVNTHYGLPAGFGKKKRQQATTNNAFNNAALVTTIKSWNVDMR